VIDGDTIAVGNRRVRVTQLNTPEIKGRCMQERALALEARALTSELVYRGVRLRMDPTARQDRDFFGRELRDVVLHDGRSLADVLKATESRAHPGFRLGYDYTKGASRHFDWCGRPPVR
jgi:endonuclease YncB( thermonuclease family)